jgi:hypothetical protein
MRLSQPMRYRLNPTRRIASVAPEGCALWALRLFILPHTVAGVFLIWQVMLTVAWLHSGTDVTGRITRAWEEQHRKGPIFYIEYRYDDAGGEHVEKDTVSRALYGNLPPSVRNAGLGPPPRSSAGSRSSVSAPIPLRLLDYASSRLVRPLPPYGSSPRAQLAGNIFAALFWNGILSVFLYQLWIKPMRLRRQAAAAAARFTS